MGKVGVVLMGTDAAREESTDKASLSIFYVAKSGFSSENRLFCLHYFSLH
jgi:hypothetical protein